MMPAHLEPPSLLAEPPGHPAPRRVARRLAAALLVAGLALLAAIGGAGPGPARAEPVTSANVTAELLSDQETIRPGEAFSVGIALRPSPDWHTYWQNPGDSGLPTKVDWKLPSGFRAGQLEWPHPVRLGEPPLVTFGYEGDALLLTRIEAPSSLRAGSEVDLAASVRWLACREDACVPGKADLALRMRVETSPPERDSRWRALFDTARAEVPRSIDGWSATVSEHESTVRIEVSAPADVRPSTTGVNVYPVTGKVIDASSEPVVRATDAGFVVEVAKDQNAKALPEMLGLVLVADGGWDADGNVRALSLTARSGAASGAGGSAANVARESAAVVAVGSAAVAGPAVAEAEPAQEAARDDTVRAAASPPAQAAAPASAASTGITFWAAVGLAFLGGIILNLMPCVFPVLSLKVLGFVHVAHHESAVARRHGYAFTAGVLVSFWILAGLLLALRAAGGVLGWGFQLQEPLFVAAIAALLLAMALNLLGVFEVGASVTGAVGRFDSQSGYRGSFLSGVLATLLATPCSAPFMGTAIGYALVQPATTSIAVFTALGVGMASPYLLLACVPALLQKLPRPGAWMEHFRQAMAFPLLATVAWLVWVFGQQTGNDGVLGLLLALLVGSMGAWIGGRFIASGGLGIARVLAGLCILAAAALMVSAATSAPAIRTTALFASEAGTLQWMPWDPTSIDRHRSEGRVVFVDFTADWCLSCKVNERVALSGEEFAKGMSDANAIAMKADWTSADPRITEALAAFGRSGVPLYVVYPRDPAREPIVLPQILTPALVREALARATA